MPIYQFQGRDQNGHTVDGERFSPSESVLSNQLQSEGIIPVSIVLPKKSRGAFSELAALLKSKKITSAQLSMFTRQMYTLSKAGVPIIAAIKHLSNNTYHPRMTQILRSLADKLEAGQSLSHAMEAYPDVFPPLILGMVQVGQNSGRLDEAFLNLTEYLELETGTVKKAKAAIRYPTFVLCAIIVGVIIINIFVIPTFSKVYTGANIPLPPLTKVLIAISNFMVNEWYVLLAIFIGVFILLKRYFKTPQGHYLYDKTLLGVPILGILLRRIILQRFTQTFAIVVKAGIPIIEGLNLVSESINNQFARQEIAGMQEAIQRGSSIVQAAYSCKLFTPLEIQMLAISEETGELGAMLTEISNYYQREVEYDLKRMTDIIEPVLLAVIALMVLMLALAVYMPIWSLVKLAHKSG